MTIKNILKLYTDSPKARQLNDLINSESASTIHLKGLHTSATSLFAGASYELTSAPFIFILNDKETAAFFQNDLKEILPEKEILFFPASHKTSVLKKGLKKIDKGSVILRTEVLDKINTSTDSIIVTYPEAVSEKVPSLTELKNNTIEIANNEKISSAFITDMLTEFGFERVDFVYEPGQFAIRGSILDVFSFSNDLPFRIDFFDDEVESLRTFDAVTQLSIKKFDKVTLVADIQNDTEETQKVSFFEVIDKKTIIWSDGFKYLKEKSKELLLEENISIEEFKTVEFSNKSSYETDDVIKFRISNQTDFNKNFELLAEQLMKHKKSGFENYLFSEKQQQVKRLQDILDSDEIKQKQKLDNDKISTSELFQPVITLLHTGFIDRDLKISFYTDHQILGRYHKFRLKSSSYHSNKEAITLQEINDLKQGDFIVHSDHGIGKFGGLQVIDNNGKKQEAVRLFYKNNDILLVNIHNLHKISKFKGKEGTQPKIYKLGSNAWQKIKSKTKSKVKDIARELISLYAKRKQEKGFAFSPDSYLQNALESSFIYDETPDQIKTVEALKADMENPVPMDRLVCGDVGFGKTEVAIRAAFKAVADGKQVAVLVPTTVLALQHFKTFSSRLSEMPCNVDFVSRLKTAKQQKETIQRLEKGEIDILIGTHRIVSKDIKFKDLGLLVIDEEQKFGVAIKEKLKAYKTSVDTLTLTATPIPRTLQFSLMGARDLSIINTPPSNRYPIITELHTFDKQVIKDAISYEIQRNGQVFFINNRIDTIYDIERLIQKLVPYAKTAVVHGQMPSTEMEKTMTGFINEDFNVLIATTIIESGLDIPNANTIIINKAQNFGLSDLHQLRGRVGRSNEKAFCYLLAPPLSAVTPEAKQRLRAVETFSELGSGFNIAMQDLDIRGAGDLLGGEQSGFISDIGFETYHRILEEAVFELKDEEFKNLFSTSKNENEPEEVRKFVNDCHIETDLEIIFPAYYIYNIDERLKIYSKLDKIKEESELVIFEQQLEDRFGKLPEVSRELINVVRLRITAMLLGIEKIIIKRNQMTCRLIPNEESQFYQTEMFTKILTFTQKFPNKLSLETKKNKPVMIFQNIKSIKEALKIFNLILEI